MEVELWSQDFFMSCYSGKKVPIISPIIYGDKIFLTYYKNPLTTDSGVTRFILLTKGCGLWLKYPIKVKKMETIA